MNPVLQYSILIALLILALGLAVRRYFKSGKLKHDSSKWGAKKK